MTMANVSATKPIPRSLMYGVTDAVAIAMMNSMSMKAPNQKKASLSMPSFSSKPATRRAASARSSLVARLRIPKTLAPITNVTIVATATNGLALRKKVTKLIPAAVPTMMLGTELMRVSKPPTLVRNPSIKRNPSSLSERSSLLSDTVLREPTMIMAVTLFSTAEKATVMSP